MNIILWILQALMALAFFIPGIYKLIFSKEQLVAKGMTGVETFSQPVIRIIGIMEILGAIGIVLPMLLNILPALTIVSAIGFAIIMIAAARISYKRHEYKKITSSVIIFLLCIFIVYARIPYLS